MHLPSGKGIKEIEGTIIEEFNLNAKDIFVTAHQPEPFLIRYEHRDTRGRLERRCGSIAMALSYAYGSGAA
jgi:hypothetical protein